MRGAYLRYRDFSPVSFPSSCGRSVRPLQPAKSSTCSPGVPSVQQQVGLATLCRDPESVWDCMQARVSAKRTVKDARYSMDFGM